MSTFLSLNKAAGQAKLKEMIDRKPKGEETPSWLSGYLKIAFDRLLIAGTSLGSLLTTGSKILDVGGNQWIQEVLEAAFQMSLDYSWTNHKDFDLRKTPLTAKDNTYDVVMCWETIEHLWSISDDGVISFDGVRKAMAEMYRVLKPGGAIHITTTNRVCPRVFLNYLAGQEAQINCTSLNHEGHAREFSGPELMMVAKGAGFRLARISSFNGYNLHFSRAKVVTVKGRMEKAFGRKLLPYELYDTLLLTARK